MRILLSISAILLLVGVTVFVDLPGDTAMWRELQNTAHTPMSVLLFVLVWQVLRAWPAARVWSAPVVLFSAWVLTVGAGIGIELVQWRLARDADIMDVVRDSLGATAGLGLAAAYLARDWLWRAASIGAALVAAAVSLYPLTSLYLAYQARDEALPELLQCHATWTKRFWAAQEAAMSCVAPPPEWSASHTVLRVIEGQGDYPGVALREPYPNWLMFKALTLVIFVPGDQPLELTLRAHDRRHNQKYSDRYNADLVLHPGENRVRVSIADIFNAPRGRRMDLTQMRGITLFGSRPKVPREFYVGEVRLE